MMVRDFGLATGLLFSLVWGQQQGQHEPPQKNRQDETQQEQNKREPEQQRPTLGPAPEEPSLYGPRSSTTNDSRKLLRIQKIFVEPIDNLLSDKLISGLAKMGRFQLVSQRGEADAVVRGTCFDSRRLKMVHSEVYINDRASGGAIWQDSLRRPFNPPPLAKAIEDTAARILAHLTESIQEAQHKQ